MSVTESRNFVVQAELSAQRAAEKAGVSIQLLTELSNIQAAEQLLSKIWGVDSTPLVPANLIKAMIHSNNYVSGAFAEDRLVGTSIGFLGRKDGHLHLHSHVTGVDPALQSRSVGFALKQHQRFWTIRNGLEEVVWTFDPLVRRNGYFNIAKLGAEIVDYKMNFYGDMRDGINADDDSDRCVVVWRVTSERAIEAADGRHEKSDFSVGATVVLAESENDEPVRSPIAGDILLAQVPRDIVAMRRTAPAGAAAWRRALRDTFQSAFTRGYSVTEMTSSGAYVLTRRGQ